MAEPSAIQEMEENDEEMLDSASSSSAFDSDDGELSAPGEEEELNLEQPLTEEEIQELISEFLEVESKAAEAQETLEKESLTRVENEVRDELARALNGDDLEKAVTDEMTTFREEWEASLDELETESAHLLEQLDGAGIELPKLYKLIESEVPNACSTEAWKKRAHWVGSQVTNEVTESVADAEKFLQSHRPVRKRHGKLLEEGASGFLQKKFAEDGVKDSLAETSEIDWPSLNKVFSDKVSKEDLSFGSKHWASVYLASTPQQAAAMGLEFPGVNEVEEIDEVDVSSADPFVADAIENERELALSEEQKTNFRQVKEEDDINVDRKLQLRLKQRRRRKRSKQGITRVAESEFDEPQLDGYSNYSLSDKISEDKMVLGDGEDMCESQTVVSDMHKTHERNGIFKEIFGVSSVPRESDEDRKTSIIDSDEEIDSVDDKPHGSGKTLHCTACTKMVVEVHSHPLLKVIVCWDCRCLLEDKLLAKDGDCVECYCGWCGQTVDLLSCKSCKMLFCSTCIKRNLGEGCLSEIQSSGWDCCCCSPKLLKKLSLELEKAMEDDESTDSSSDGKSGNSDTDVRISVGTKKRPKKKIRRIIDDAELGEETKRKIAIEKERQERLKSLQSSATFKTMSFAGSMRNIPEGVETVVLGDASTGYVVNVVREIGEEAVRIPPSISKKLKVHQVTGIRFMWENIVQSISKVKSGDKGLGCILAHTMGLGKTFQVIAFLYTAMRCVDLGLNTALIVTPVNVLHNWRSEFMKWRPSEVKPLRIFMLEDVSRERRLELLLKWRKKGGVFLIGYTSFRNLSFGIGLKDRPVAREICSVLQDGPDILVCDEAHIIKNTKADTTQALKQVKCQRRIALTGSPLQNNLMEYYCMVDFVREGFLGSSHEFRNRFQNPIENGQHTNSTAVDVKIMNQRSHILYEQLKGFVQRMDMSVVKTDLPPKTVFVIAVKLSALQRKLYKRFLRIYGVSNDEGTKKNFFAGYQVLAQMLNHPGILRLTKEDSRYRNRRHLVDLADDCSSDENIDYNVILGEKQPEVNDILLGKVDGCPQKDWWNDLLHRNNYKVPDYSGKMVLLLDILTMCSDIGDKALVFSQSIPTLDLIELFLSKQPRRSKQGKFWKKGKDWYRLDGKTESSERQKLVERFNEPENKRVKCVLISTRAGSLGINLYAANRVIIVDGSWNPTYDLQAIFRAWRYGQKKPVFAYRLMACGTIEEKIYKRQVTKEGLAARVVDRQQVHRTISKEEMLHLFEFDDDDDEKDLSRDKENVASQSADPEKQKVSLSGSCSSDRMMQNLLKRHSPSWISNFHEHETLLQENEDEKLTKEEKDMAWEVYQKTLEWEEVQRTPLNEFATLQKPAATNAPPPPPAPRPPPRPKGFNRSRFFVQRNCSDISHKLTLISQGTKAGCIAVCGSCAREIRWEDVNGNLQLSS